MASKLKSTPLTAFPEEEMAVENMGIKIYGETSYENQIAVLSHYLHNHCKEVGKAEQAEIISAIRAFLTRKEMRQKLDLSDWSDEQVLKVAEAPAQQELFSEFFNVPFPAPKDPRNSYVPNIFDVQYYAV